ncbi:MAG: peptidoglycan-binding domain-containing protein [Pseudomonadota bacterium]
MADRFERHEPTLDGYEDAAMPNAYDRRNHRVNVRQAHAASADPVEDAVFDDEWDVDPVPSLAARVKAVSARTVILGVAFIAFALVTINAAFFQPGAHPAPMMATRELGPADRLPAGTDDAAIIPRDVAAAPAPSARPVTTQERTASIPQPVAVPSQTERLVPDLSSLARQPYAAPAPAPRPASFARAPTQRPASVSQPLPPLPSVAPRQVQTVPLADPIAALLQPIAPPSSVPARSSQPLVAAVQAVLSQLGYAPGSVDGVMGPGTEEAIRRFQLRRALEPNGQITNDLIREIERVTGQRVSSS